MKAIWADPFFSRLAPLSATCVGTAWGLQGLWAAPWLADVEALERPAIVQRLLVMALALSVGALVIGIGAERLRARGVRPHYALALVAMLSAAVQVALILRLPIPSLLCWSLIAVAGAAPVLSYASLAEYFPKEVIGRANGALGVVDISGAFLLQFVTGLVIQQWPDLGGHYPTRAYKTAFATQVGLELVALAWFALPDARQRVSGLARQFFDPLVRSKNRARLPTPVEDRQEMVSWQFVALGSITLSALLGTALAISTGRANVVTYVVEVEAPRQVAIARVVTPTPDPQFEPVVSGRTVSRQITRGAIWPRPQSISSPCAKGGWLFTTIPTSVTVSPTPRMTMLVVLDTCENASVPRTIEKLVHGVAMVVTG